MQIYAHRGASDDFPELTLAAYEGAVEQGADGFECDVRLTKDEVAVLWHNASMLERAGNPGLIAEMTFAQVEKAYPQILTLRELLDFAVLHRKGILIETKHPVISGNRVEEVIVDLIRRTKRISTINVGVMSFSWFAVEKMKRLAPEIKTTYLMQKFTTWPQVKHSSASAIGPEIDSLRARPITAKRIKDLGRSLYVWTVNESSDIKLCEQIKVDFLITDKPAHAREVLRYP